MPNYFERSLVQGHAGEQRMLKLLPGLKATDGYKHDLEAKDGTRIELKTESRSTYDTLNLAVEFASSDGRTGAIHNACLNSDVIVWLYSDDKFFAYKPKELFNFIVDYGQSKFRQVKVANAGYESTVLLVPRAAVSHLEVQLA